MSNARPLIAASSPLGLLKRQRRFVARRLRVLMLRDRYHVQEECRAAWVALGHEIVDVWLGPAPSAQAMIEAVLNAVVAWRPDMVMSINFFGFDRQNWMAQVLAACGMPCAVWCVDSPLLTLRGWLPPVHEQLHLFVWDKSYVRALKALGAAHVHHLPLAAAKRRKQAVRSGEQGTYPACFVGGSLEGAKASWGKTLSDAQRAPAAAWAETLRRTPEALQTLLPAPAAPPCPATLLLGMAQAGVSAAKRREALSTIARDELHIWGDDGWLKALPGAVLHGRCSYGDELDSLSRASDITLNVTSAQMPSGVNQRVFDVPQSGSFLLTDAQEELFDLFDARTELATFTTPAACGERFLHFRKHPSERAKIVAQAQLRIEREHLYEHRVARIEQIMRHSCARRFHAVSDTRGHVHSRVLPS